MAIITPDTIVNGYLRKASEVIDVALIGAVYPTDADEMPTLALNLCRLSRGRMLGVDFNKDFTWVGSSVALQPA